jgi:UDP-N-acetylglucosamine 2-epimerase (non-hydrolysing)
MAADSRGPVACVVGTRPEVIKMFPVLDALRRSGVDTRLLNTGQHSGLCRDAFDAFGLEPDIDLAVMTEGQTPTQVAARVLDRLGPVLDELQPSWLVVQGDTTTVLAAAIAGSYNRVPVAHVEAGLRSHDPREPFPEEINRRAVSAIANLHFAPTQTAWDALLREGIDERQIVLTGNTVIDALQWACRHLPAEPADPALLRLDRSRPIVLLTAHRRENFGSRMAQIFEAVLMLADRRPELQFLFPVHPNPAVRADAERLLSGAPNVVRTEPLGYLDMAWALQHCSVVLTDSGGLQEEAPAIGRPVLVLRDVTERPEAIEWGLAQLVGTEPERVVSAVLQALDRPGPSRGSPYGDGRAGDRIAAALRGLPVTPFRSIPRAA